MKDFGTDFQTTLKSTLLVLSVSRKVGGENTDSPLGKILVPGLVGPGLVGPGLVGPGLVGFGAGLVVVSSTRVTIILFSPSPFHFQKLYLLSGQLVFRCLAVDKQVF